MEELQVRDAGTGMVTGTCRILSPEAAERTGGYPIEHDFDLEMLAPLRGRIVEVGEISIRPGFGSSDVMQPLLSKLARYLIENGYDYLLGAVSVDLADGGHAAASIHRAACEKSASPEDCRVFPHRRLPLENLRDMRPSPPPPPLKAWLHAGAWICGDPAHDPVLACAQLPILLSLARMHDRHARHFLAHAA